MQYLHLVYLAERKNGAPADRERVAASAPVAAVAAVDASRAASREIPPPSDDDGPFFTDGPYVETKEYIVGSRTF
jgi:hypothetical protein